MDAPVGGKLGMKGCSHSVSLPNGDRVGAFGGEDFDAVPDVDDLRGADEDHFERVLAQYCVMRIAGPMARQELAFADRAIDLASVGVAADADVEGAEPLLWGVLDFGSKQDCASAGAERWLGVDEIFQLGETFFAKEFQERSGLTSGNDEAVDVIQLLGFFDEHNFGTQLFEPPAVGVEIALQG